MVTQLRAKKDSPDSDLWLTSTEECFRSGIWDIALKVPWKSYDSTNHLFSSEIQLWEAWFCWYPNLGFEICSKSTTYSYIRVLVFVNFNSLFLRKKEFVKFDIYSRLWWPISPIEGNTPPMMVSAALVDTRGRTWCHIYCVIWWYTHW